MLGSIGLPELLLVVTIAGVGLLAVALPASQICRRIGLSPLLGLLAVIPIANILLLWFVAFSPWPSSERRQHDA